MATIRLASPFDLDRVRHAYLAWGYNGGVMDWDLVYLAEDNEALVGVVRRTQEHGVAILRGMNVAPAYQRQGIGSQLLAALTRELGNVECWCLPYRHLVSFYSAGGFALVPDSALPPFLQHRLRDYRTRGLDCLAMQRR